MTEKTPKTSNPDQTDDSTKKQTPATDPAATGATASAQDKPVVTPDNKSASKTSKSAVRADDKAKTPAGSGGRSGDKTPPPPPPPPTAPAPSAKRKNLTVIPVVFSLAALVLVGVLWYQHTVSQDVIAQLDSQNRASADQARVAGQQAEQALDALRQQGKKIDELAAGLRESKSEFESLNDAFQMITDRGSDLVLLNDIDHLVVIAQQQLQLSGNVANAIISLETAQAQLARANRPALASLQQTINGDLDRLRAARTVDIALLSGRLDELASLIGQAPLLVPDDVVPGTMDSQKADAPGKPSPQMADVAAFDDIWWKKALAHTKQWTLSTWTSLRHDLGQFISVRRVDDATALLISPDQATRFRDNLRLRVMTAQLALMMGQPQIWATETDALVNAIQSRFDPQSALTRRAVKIARDVADTAIDTPLPDVTNSIKALEAIREQTSESSTQGQGPEPESAAGDADNDSAITPSGADVTDEARDADTAGTPESDKQLGTQG